ncbi:RNA methylation protein TRM112 Ecym_6041 [Eremothecium cymbalariae DBVPG|uniref:Multifunctional methyltransferase subunit trm112 n=1 Tax=Eremothecium cymbalariae (strain CBS 270.75 / DBVPG 7215 / KCTC 17166 / NRRL Y-17582) TaxID=931890 RepID=G8JUW6_ERECY|nr:hypothetical protein Ecym_6041 [Eremothecium cymbalariae DBVPG\
MWREVNYRVCRGCACIEHLSLVANRRCHLCSAVCSSNNNQHHRHASKIFLCGMSFSNKKTLRLALFTNNTTQCLKIAASTGLLAEYPSSIFMMKFLTTNFIKCSVPACDKSNDNFPLRYIGDKCQLQQDNSIEFNAEFLMRILDRVEWNAVVAVAEDLGNSSLPEAKPQLLVNGSELSEEDITILRDLHTLLMQTSIVEGEMQCRNCGHIYYIKNSIPNLLLPPHLA